MPQIEQIDIDPSSRLGIWEVEESIDELKWALQWGQEDIKRFKAFTNQERSLHWLAGRVLLRKMLNTTKFIDLQVDEFGKPFLRNFDTQLSISHSGKRVAVLLSDRPCGVDIQVKDEKIEKLASKFISSAEWEELDEDNLVEKIHLIWGAKEAMYKVYGKRKLEFRENLFVNPFQWVSSGRVRGRIEKGNYIKDLTLSYIWKDNYMLVYTIDKG